MNYQFQIQTYASLPTDLASELRCWPEFISGDGHSALFRDAQTGEEVSVRLRATSQYFPTVTVEGRSRTPLLDKALGRVIQAAVDHSDTVMVFRRTIPYAR